MNTGFYSEKMKYINRLFCIGMPLKFLEDATTSLLKFYLYCHKICNVYVSFLVE